MLAEFLAQTRSEPFRWGHNDCALWCASAVAFETGFDPAAHLRGTYASWFECRQILMEAGGLLALSCSLMDRADVVDLRGDGVAVMRHGGQTICGLIVEGRAIFKVRSGLQVVDRFEILRGWSCPKH